MAEAFGGEIPKLLVSGDTLDVVKQSAALCLLRLFRTDPSVIPSGENRHWVDKPFLRTYFNVLPILKNCTGIAVEFCNNLFPQYRTGIGI
jgi:hypothetical protein